MKYNMVAILSYCCCYCCSVTAACSNSTSPWTAKHQTPHSSNISQSFLKFMSTESVMLPNHLILCSLLSFLPSVFPSIKVFSNEFALHIRWSFNFSNSPFNEYSALISFKIDQFDLLAVQRALRVFSSTTIHKYQFFDDKPSLWSTLTSAHGYWKKCSFDYMDLCRQNDVSAF